MTSHNSVDVVLHGVVPIDFWPAGQQPRFGGRQWSKKGEAAGQRESGAP